MRQFLILLLLSLACCGCLSRKLSQHREEADEQFKKKNYDAAIQGYWNHIDARLKVKNRPEWENPYLYLLDIGDVYLEQGNVEQALKYYLLAEKRGVKDGYVNDRIRNIAVWYEKKGDLRKALEHLQQHRDRDEVLFDLMLDRISKMIVAEEERKAEE